MANPKSSAATPAVDSMTAVLQLATPTSGELVTGANIQFSAGDLAQAKITDIETTIKANVRKVTREKKAAVVVLQTAEKAYNELTVALELPATLQAKAAKVVAELQPLFPGAALQTDRAKATAFKVTINAATQSYDVTVTIEVPNAEDRYRSVTLTPRETFPFSAPLKSAYKAFLDAQQQVALHDSKLHGLNRNLAELPALTKRFTSAIVKTQMNQNEAAKTLMAQLEGVEKLVQQSMGLDTNPELLALTDGAQD